METCCLPLAARPTDAGEVVLKPDLRSAAALAELEAPLSGMSADTLAAAWKKGLDFRGFG